MYHPSPSLLCPSTWPSTLLHSSSSFKIRSRQQNLWKTKSAIWTVAMWTTSRMVPTAVPTTTSLGFWFIGLANWWLSLPICHGSQGQEDKSHLSLWRNYFLGIQCHGTLLWTAATLNNLMDSPLFQISNILSYSPIHDISHTTSSYSFFSDTFQSKVSRLVAWRHLVDRRVNKKRIGHVRIGAALASNFLLVCYAGKQRWGVYSRPMSWWGNTWLWVSWMTMQVGLWE